MWYAVKSVSVEEHQSRIKHCLEIASQATNVLNELGVPAWRNKFSNIVVFPKPSEAVWRKYHLAVENAIAHIVVNGHVRSLDTLLPALKDIATDLHKTTLL
ncbi:hypothetical protein [Zooshikella sp. RANM57]|uniref:hypothetical protein n=1 Tax=Zooshikella sp. RANM57 TaxID=3425863 RepID=UPI003D6E372D